MLVKCGKSEILYIVSENWNYYNHLEKRILYFSDVLCLTVHPCTCHLSYLSLSFTLNE